MPNAVFPTLPNTKLLLSTLAATSAQPERLDQAIWWPKPGCGTACCFAGNALQIAGIRAAHVNCRQPDGAAQHRAVVLLEELPEGIAVVVAASVELPVRLRRVPVYHGVDDPSAAYVTVADAARVLLGLSLGQANNLFAPENTPADLKEIVGDLCEAARFARQRA